MPEPQICDECRLIRAELFDAMKAQLRDDREREKNASVPFAERLRTMTEADWNEMSEARQSSRATQLWRKLRHHQLSYHAGRYF